MSIITNEQLEQLRDFDTPTICNAIEAFGIRPRSCGFGFPGMVQRVSYTKPMVGYACTAKFSAFTPATDAQKPLMMQYYDELSKVDGPSIAIIRDIDPVPMGSFWGEVQASIHKALGCVGTLTQGGVRDVPEVEKLGFYFMSTHMLVSHSYNHITAVQVPVEICGLTIEPGDIIHADIHGFTVIPPSIVSRLYEACQDIANAELPVLEPCRLAIKKGVRPTMDELSAWRKNMASARVKADAKYGLGD